MFALWKLGAVVIPVASNLTDPELQKIISLTKAVSLVSAKHACQLFTATRPPRHSSDISLNSDAALLLFSSGSMGEPKGIVISHSALRSKINTLSSCIPENEIHHSLCILPTHFGHGLIGNSLFPLLTGQNLFLYPPLNLVSARGLRDVLIREKINFFSSVPSFWPQILAATTSSNSALPDLRRAHCASAPLSPQLAEKMVRWSPSTQFYNVFGMTETLSWIGADQINHRNPPSMGTRIETFWGARGSVEFDELVLETKDLFSHYLHEENQTSSVTIRSKRFRSGDLAFLDNCKNIIVLGRLDNIINVGGIKVSPEEVNQVLMQITFIQDACTIGVPDLWAGERVVSAVVLKRDLLINPDLAKEQILEYLSKVLSSQKIPNQILILTDIPRSDRGKIVRTDIAKLFKVEHR